MSAPDFSPIAAELEGIKERLAELLELAGRFELEELRRRGKPERDPWRENAAAEAIAKHLPTLEALPALLDYLSIRDLRGERRGDRRQPIAAGDFPSIRGGSSGNSFIVCDDGSAFRLETDTGEGNELLRVRWVELPPIPGTAADEAFGYRGEG